MNANEVIVTGIGAGHFPGRFTDVPFGSLMYLLTRPGAIRWLPDRALTAGTAGDALEIGRQKIPLRDLS